MLLKKHDEKDSVGTSRKWQQKSKGLGGATSTLLPWFVQGLCGTFPAGFNMDLIHMEKRTKTPDPSLGEFLWTAGQGGEVRGRERSTPCKTFPLAVTQEFLWEPKVLLACGGAKTNLIYTTEN